MDSSRYSSVIPKNLILIDLGRRGAISAYSYQMAVALLESNCKLVCYISKYTENIMSWEKLCDRYDTLTLYKVKTYNNIWQFFFRSLNVFRFLLLTNSINKQKSKYLYIPGIHRWTPFFMFFLKDKYVITTIHDFNMHPGERNIIIEWLNAYVIRKSDKIVSLNKMYINSISERYNLSLDCIYYIPHGNFNYYVSNYFYSDVIYNKVLFVGRIIKYKGLIVLLRAMEKLWQQGHKIILKIAGYGSITNEECFLIEKYKDNIEYTNNYIPDNEMQNCFFDIDLTILPYIEASQSGVIPLSYSFGKPVIASNVGALPEQIYQDTGLLVNPGDPDDLANAIRICYIDRQKLLYMRRKAKETADIVLSWMESAKRLLQLVEKP